MPQTKKEAAPKVTPADIIKNKIKYYAAQRETMKSKEEGLTKELDDTKSIGLQVIGAIKALQDLLRDFEQ